MIPRVNVDENAKRIAKHLEHLIKLVEIVTSLSQRRTLLLRHSRTRFIGRHVKTHIWPLTHAVTGALLILHLKNMSALEQTSFFERLLKSTVEPPLEAAQLAGI